MALNELKETARTLPTEVESTVNSHLEYYKLYIFRIIAKTTMGFVSLGLCLGFCYRRMA